MTRWFSLAVLLLCPVLAAADTLRTLDGKVHTGTLTDITATDVILQTESGPVKTPMAQVLFLDLRPAKGLPAGTKYIDVRLLDDTVLHCQDVAFLGKEVELTLLSGAKFKLALSYITWFLRNAQDPGLMAQWEKMTKEKIRTDRVIVQKAGDLIPLEGLLGAVDPEAKTITFTQEGVDPYGAKLDKVAGLIFFRPDPPKETPICRVLDTQGNALSATNLLLKKDAIELTTTFGGKVELAADAVSRIDFNMGKLAFLSDMEPSRVVEKFALGWNEPYRRDANLDGQPIQLQEKSFVKGLSMHAYTELEYELGGKFKEFKAMVGADQRVGATPSRARVAIYLDGALKFNETVTGKSWPLALEVAGVNSLRIVVSSPDIFGRGDHATVGDAQLTK